jgi:hypothetical protein
MELREEHILVIVLTGLLLLFMASKIGVFCFGNDGYFHASGGLFFYDVFKWWVSNPTFSFEEITAYIINYQAQFKFFGGISYYPPLQSVVIAFLSIFAGKSMEIVYLAAAVEAVLAIYFTIKLYELLYGKRTKMMYLLVFFIAINPVFFAYAASATLDPGMTLFTVMSMYYLILFMRKEENKYLYLTAVTFGFGVIMKRPMVLILPILFMTLLLEKKLHLLRGRAKPLIASVIISILIISPLLAMELLYLKMGVNRIGARLLFTIVSDPAIISEYLSHAIFSMFGHYFLIIFFIAKVIDMKKKRVNGELGMLFLIVALFIFFNFFAHVEDRYLLPTLPFTMIFSVNGIQLLTEKYPKSRVIPLLVLFIVLTLPLICYGYQGTIINVFSASDYTEAAKFVSENTEGIASVISPYSRTQALAFNMLDDKKIYTVHSPYEYCDGTSRDEFILMLDTEEGCLPRPTKPEWERFGICHPPIEWALVQEKWDGRDFCYNMTVILDERADFCLLKTIEGRIPNTRTFIYRRC